MSSQIQSSLRDSRRSSPECPGTKVPGYIHGVPNGTPPAQILEGNNISLVKFAWSASTCV